MLQAALRQAALREVGGGHQGLQLGAPSSRKEVSSFILVADRSKVERSDSTEWSEWQGVGKGGELRQP